MKTTWEEGTKIKELSPSDWLQKCLRGIFLVPINDSGTHTTVGAAIMGKWTLVV